MNELQKSLHEKSLEELIKILERQEEMVTLLENFQLENESLEQTEVYLREQISSLEKQLSESQMDIKEKEEDLDELTKLNNSLNSENAKLHSQIQELLSLKE